MMKRDIYGHSSKELSHVIVHNKCISMVLKHNMYTTCTTFISHKICATLLSLSANWHISGHNRTPTKPLIKGVVHKSNLIIRLMKIPLMLCMQVALLESLQDTNGPLVNLNVCV